jgi:hypothetical protein
MDMSVLFLVIVQMFMRFATEVKMTMGVTMLFIKISQADDGIDKAKCNEKPARDIAPEGFNTYQPVYGNTHCNANKSKDD